MKSQKQIINEIKAAIKGETQAAKKASPLDKLTHFTNVDVYKRELDFALLGDIEVIKRWQTTHYFS